MRFFYGKTTLKMLIIADKNIIFLLCSYMPLIWEKNIEHIRYNNAFLQCSVSNLMTVAIIKLNDCGS